MRTITVVNCITSGFSFVNIGKWYHRSGCKGNE